MNSRTTEPSNSRTSLSLNWHVIWTRSQSERLVYDQLASRGFDLFLPETEVWSRRGGTRHRVRRPMFPGYLFLHHAMEMASYLAVCQARGVVKMLGESWDRLAIVPNAEISHIQKLHQSQLQVTAHPYLRVGERVRIAQGLLEGLEGILLRTRLEKGLVIVSVNLLQRSVAVEVDCALVTPA